MVDTKNNNYKNLIAYILNAVLVNGIGGAGWFGLADNVTLSKRYQTLVTPAGWAFAIWGLICTAQLIWTIAQLLPSNKNAAGSRAVGSNYLWVCLIQVGWTFSFGLQKFWLSLVFMVGLLFFLWQIVKSLDGVRASYFLWKFPFVVNFAWMLAAATVNVNLLLVVEEASSSLQYWVGLGSLSVLLMAGYALKHLRDYTIYAVLVWALLAVNAELNSPMDSITERFDEKQIESVQQFALAVAAILITGAFLTRE
jgi:hypothetical protein